MPFNTCQKLIDALSRLIRGSSVNQIIINLLDMQEIHLPIKLKDYCHLLQKANLTLYSDCCTLAITLVGSFEAPLARKKSRTSKFVSAPALASKL